MAPGGLPARADHLREQFERAARFQRSLLPDVSRPIGGFRVASLYRPCDTVGGDFYDLALRDESALLLVADVMGHGVRAAFVTMLVKAAFQESALATGDPGEALGTMHARLRRTLPAGMFVAAAVARLAPDGAEMRLANAGLPHPFVLRAGEGRVDEVGVDGVPLGLLDGVDRSEYDASVVTLAPGDVLLLASDGVGSVEDRCGRCFGERCLREALDRLVGCKASEILDRLMSEADVFGGGRPLPDDVDIVAVSREAADSERAVVGVADRPAGLEASA